MSTPTEPVQPANPTPPVPPTPAPPANPPAPQPPATPPAGQDPATGDVSSLPPWAQKIISDARADAAKARTGAKQQAADDARKDFAQQIGKALGLVQDDAPLTPEQLQQQLTEARTQGTTAQQDARSAILRAALWETASQHGANPAALRDSVSFLESVKDIDPTDSAAVVAAAKAAVASNPALAAASPAAGRSAPDGTPTGANGTPPSRPTSLTQAVSRRLGRG